MKWIVLPIVALLAGPVVAHEPKALRQQIVQALEDARENRLEDSAVRLRAVVSSEGFGALPSAEQHAALLLSANVALKLEDPLTALEYYELSTRFAEASAQDWAGRFKAAYWAENWADAARCLVELATRWPEQLADLSYRMIFWTYGELDSPTDEAARIELADALFDANWVLPGDYEPSNIWQPLAVQHLVWGNTDRVRAIVERITEPVALVSLRVDHRFAAFVAASPGRFDIDRAMKASLAQSAAAMRGSPRSLELLKEHCSDLLRAGAFEEALGLANDALARIDNAKPDTPPFDDMAKYRPWIMNDAAIALFRLGRHQEALAQLESAREFDEHGDPNVSQTINLAGSYLDAGRASEALALVEQLDWGLRGGMSAYGKMQVQRVRHGALRVLGESAEAARALQYMRDHQLDAVGTYQRALVEANDLDAAAELIKSRLADTRQRDGALLAVQQGLGLPRTAIQSEYDLRWEALLSRADVQAAIATVGRRERFNIVLTGT